MLEKRRSFPVTQGKCMCWLGIWIVWLYEGMPHKEFLTYLYKSKWGPPLKSRPFKIAFPHSVGFWAKVFLKRSCFHARLITSCGHHYTLINGAHCQPNELLTHSMWHCKNSEKSNQNKEEKGKVHGFKEENNCSIVSLVVGSH